MLHQILARLDTLLIDNMQNLRQQVHALETTQVPVYTTRCYKSNAKHFFPDSSISINRYYLALSAHPSSMSPYDEQPAVIYKLVIK